jgi:hypothetical protein
MVSMNAAIATALATLLGGVVAAAIAVNVYYTNDSGSLDRKIEAGQERVNQMQDRGIENMRRRIGEVEKPKSPSSFR